MYESSSMKKKYVIAIGADHRGFEHKQFLMQHSYAHVDIIWIDVGAFSQERSDYPEFALAAVKPLLEKKVDYAVLLCATGVGMAIVANRFPGIFAGVAWNAEIAASAKEDDKVNIIVIPSGCVTHEEAVHIFSAWLSAEFKHGRYEERIAMIDAINV